MVCFSFLCPDGGGLDPAGLRAATTGIRDISKGYRKLADIDLPHGAAQVLATLRKTILQLERLVEQAKSSTTEAVPFPLEGEQRQWVREFPQGGLLLRRQTCMASNGNGEWFAGLLFIGEKGLVFDAGYGSGEEGLYTGFLPWRVIQEVEGAAQANGGPARELRLAIQGTSTRLTSLHLQLSMPKHSEWLTEFWAVGVEGARPQRKLTGSIGNAVPQKGATATPLLEEEPKDAIGQHGERIVTIVHETASAERRLFMPPDPSRPPPSSPPEGAEPVWSTTIPDISLATVSQALLSDEWPITSLRKKLGCTDITISRWTGSQCVEGTQVRQAVFRMPLSKDVPWAVQRLLSFPSSSMVTMMYRLRETPEELTLVCQAHMQDMKIGEYMRGVEFVRFRPAASGGVRCCVFGEVVWVSELPWALSGVKLFVEKSFRDDTAADGKQLTDHLTDVLRSPPWSEAPGGQPTSSEAPPLQRQETTTFCSAAAEEAVFVPSPWGTSSAPASAAPTDAEPVWMQVLPGVSIEALRSAFEADDDWPMVGFWQKLQYTEITLSRWVESQHVPETRVRRARYRMPVPQDVPRSVAALMSIPKDSMATTAFRWRRTEEELTLVAEVLTEDVMFGPNFRVVDLTTFRGAPGGSGVECRKYVRVVWVEALPWSATPVKAIVEKKSISGGVDTGKQLADHLLEVFAS